MFIVEGPDNVGKTTVCKRIVEMAAEQFSGFPIYYNHMSRPPAGFNFFSHYKYMISAFAVQDRFHLGGIVYHDAIPEAKLRFIESWLLEVGSFIVVMYNSDDSDYESRYKETAGKQEQMYKLNDCIGHNQKFRNLWSRGNSPFVDVAWDVKKLGYPSDICLENWLKRWTSRLAILERKS